MKHSQALRELADHLDRLGAGDDDDLEISVRLVGPGTDLEVELADAVAAIAEVSEPDDADDLIDQVAALVDVEEEDDEDDDGDDEDESA